jgi:WD40-like Beta Propeller Repeat
MSYGLFGFPTAHEPELLVLDAINPLDPVQACTLTPAVGGRFITATRIAFWLGNSLRTADIGSGAVAVTATLPTVPTDGAFSPDGSRFAYRVGDDTNGLSTHLFVAGHDRTLVTRAGIGGHGGSSIGPQTQLEFSADGNYLLSVDSIFANFASSASASRNGSAYAPPNFLVYDQNGLTVFQSATAAFGQWATQGDKLYFLAESEALSDSGDLHSWDPIAGELPVAHGLNNYFWPALAPDNRRLLFNSDDSGGPHLWSIDLGTGVVGQLATGISTHPVFVATGVVWSTEEKLCSCGPGGPSAPDGKLVAHDLQTGKETSFGLAAYEGADFGTTTRFVLDVWLG